MTPCLPCYARFESIGVVRDHGQMRTSGGEISRWDPLEAGSRFTQAPVERYRARAARAQRFTRAVKAYETLDDFCEIPRARWDYDASIRLTRSIAESASGSVVILIRVLSKFGGRLVHEPTVLNNRATRRLTFECNREW